MSEFINNFRYLRRKVERSIAPIKTIEYDYNKMLKNVLGKLDFQNVIYYPQKINWIKRYLHDDLYQKCSDKYEVRDYVKEKGLEFILNELYGVYDSVDEIDFDKLPNQFVLRAIHGCGWNILCEDKSKLNIKQVKRKMKKWMKKNYYYVHGEHWYKDIKPRIVCERFLQDSKTKDLKDYKIFCFHGKPHVIQVDIGRHDNHLRNYYDCNWNLRDVYCEHDNDLNGVERPKQLDKMLAYASILSEGFIHVRIDFYVVDDHIIFGKMTFAPGSGVVPFTPISFLKEMGDLMKLPVIE
jgi:hypothetical protein